jgi:hypothetical protein
MDGAGAGPGEAAPVTVAAEAADAARAADGAGTAEAARAADAARAAEAVRGETVQEAGRSGQPATPALAGRAAWASRRRFAAFYALPLLLILAGIALPLARGSETLYMRDVLNAHLAMKWSEARALRQGYFPLLDPYRGGGQPLAGNPNAVPFYPTNALFLWASPIWALNAHFWIHLLLAPFAFHWMARRWGLAREPAWAAAVCYTASGFYLSHLSFYNLIAGATLAPALVAACLGFAGRRPPRAVYLPAIAALWALLLLSGDPLMAAMAAGLAAAALLVTWKGRWPAWGALAMLAAAFACGTLIAVPQIVEFLRILPVSFRGFRGYAPGVATIASWDPRQAAEWLLPMLFGRLDVRGGGSFWGQGFFTGAPPLFPSLYPGLLALALIVAAGRPRGRAAWWASGAAAAGLFCSLGRFNPAIDWLFARFGAGALRYPVKFWLPVAVGAALLCGLGFERLAADAAARRRFRWALAVLALVLGAGWICLNLLPGPATRWMRLLIPAGRPMPFVDNERLRWSGLCLFSLLILGALGLLARWLGRSPRAAWTCGGLLLAVHAVGQAFLLRPLYPTDAVTPYRVPPPAIVYLPLGTTVVSPDFEHLFGPSQLGSGTFPSPSLLWLERRAFYELFPFTGPMWDRRYELDESPEGLDTYLTRLSQGSLQTATDEERLRLLAAWGVGRLLIERALQPLPAHARLLATVPSFGQHLHVYEVVGRAPEIYLARRIWRAPHMTAAYRLMKSAAFEPRSDVVIPGSGPPGSGSPASGPAGSGSPASGPAGSGSPGLSAGGAVRVLRKTPESLDLDLEVGAGGSLLVVQRALLIYRAIIDGRPAPLVAANLHRNGLAVPAGRHRVRMWVDRTNFHRSLAAAALGLAGLPALGWWAWRSRAGLAGLAGLAGRAGRGGGGGCLPAADCYEADLRRRGEGGVRDAD